MSSNDEKKTRKLVGMLIEVLHGEYSDTRDLAVVQLAVLGQKAVPHICSFLEKEGELEKDMINYAKRHSLSNEQRAVAIRHLNPTSTITEDEIKSMEGWGFHDRFVDEFKKKWGSEPDEGDGEVFFTGSGNRREAIEGALRALDIIGDARAIPTLRRLPTELGEGETPIFEKVPEIIKRIQSGV